METRHVTAWVRRAALAGGLVAARAVPAWSDGVRTDLLPGLIVDAGAPPRDAASAPALDGIPGVRARVPLPADVAQRLRELAAQRAAVGAVSPAGAAAEPIAPLPGADDAPARIDSDDPDPDRLRVAPPVPRVR